MLDYQIVGENAFRVETYFGLGFIVVNQALDYEQTQTYGFMVSCIAGNSVSNDVMANMENIMLNLENIMLNLDNIMLNQRILC